jgi:serine/arginine repetitive matrix protein 2
MYNGIGLSTPRGTGTNGYVTRNLAFVRDSKKTTQYIQNIDRKGPTQRKPNEEILEHERKRRIEVQVTEWAAKNGYLDRDE